MAKTKISEWSATPADNTDISNINIAEGCSPANVNNAIRSVMAQVKDLQAGTSGDKLATAAGGTNLGSFTTNGAVYATSTSVLTTGTLPIASGGTNAITASAAATNLGLGTGDSPQFTAVNIGNATDTTITRVSAGVIAVEGNNVLLSSVEDQTITGGGIITSKDLGTKSSGTLTLDLGARALQYYINNGAHTLAPGSNAGSAIIDITNGASAGTITTSGWTKVSGDDFTTTNTNKFRCHCSVGNAGSLLVVQAMQ
jgi:hypothetical protein